MDYNEIKYLTNFILDNNLDTKTINKKDKLFKSIEIEKKKRVLIELHYLSNKLKKYKQKIYKFGKIDVNENLKPKDFFNTYKEFELDKLNKLLEECK